MKVISQFEGIPMYPRWSVRPCAYNNSDPSNITAITISSVVRIKGKHPKDRRKQCWYQTVVTTSFAHRDHADSPENLLSVLPAHLRTCIRFQLMGVAGPDVRDMDGFPLFKVCPVQLSDTEIEVRKYNNS